MTDAANYLILARLSLPLLILLGTGLLVVLLSAFLKKSQGISLFLSLLGVVAAFAITLQGWAAGSSLGMAMMTFDRLAYTFDLIFLAATLLTLVISKDYVAQENIHEGEYYALMLFATAGAMILVHASDLILLFLGLEIMSLSVYILSGLKRSAKSYEASLKYFIMGSIASGFLLYGIALMYGAAGATSFEAMKQISLPPASETLVFFSVALLLIGVGFKIAAVPFHLWSPDVYEGAPTSITAYMAAVVKAAGFAALIRIVLALGHIPQIPWVPILWTLSALTMTVGNLVALRQSNIKRMLAYSSIAHAGYALVGVTAAVQGNTLGESPLGAVLFYLFVYSLMTIGAFAVVIAVGRRGDDADEITDYDGLAKKHPFLAAALSIFLFSLMGMPPMAGFMGKFYLFSAAVEAGLINLVILGVLNSVISAYYYLGPIIAMYFREERSYKLPPLSYSLLIVIFVGLFLVLYLGILPSDVFLMARESVREIVF